MNIIVVGAGAMGSLFGALLSEAGQKVTLLDVRQDHVATVNDQGLRIQDETTTRTVRLPATVDPQCLASADLVLVFVKSNHTESAARTVARFAPTTARVLTLQNGMGNAERLADSLDPDRVLAGTTAHGATFLGPGAIRHAGAGDTVIGPWSGADMDAARQIADTLHKAGIHTRTVTDVRNVMWNKLFINVGINAITALTGIRNGELLDLEQTRQLAQDAVREAMAVAATQGIAVAGDPVEKVFLVAEATATNRSSMGQDVDHHRTTEISAINGFIVRMGTKTGIPVPINRTLAVLVETMQAHY